MTTALTTLWRPVGGYELALVVASAFARYPPRLPEQPIFYPVCTRQYAEDIAYQWNLGDTSSAFSGFITEFRVPTSVADRYPRKVVGGREHEELWVPADEQDAFCDAFEGSITVIEGRLGPRFVEVAPWWTGGPTLDAQVLPAFLSALGEHGLSGGPLTAG